MNKYSYFFLFFEKKFLFFGKKFLFSYFFDNSYYLTACQWYNKLFNWLGIPKFFYLDLLVMITLLVTALDLALGTLYLTNNNVLVLVVDWAHNILFILSLDQYVLGRYGECNATLGHNLGVTFPVHFGFFNTTLQESSTWLPKAFEVG